MIPADLVPPDCPWPVVLGLDPGTRVAGYGAVVVAPRAPRLVCCGVLEPGARLSLVERLGRIAAEFEELLRALRPSMVVVESAFAGRNVQSALRIGEARGAVLSTASRLGYATDQVAPAAAKKTLVGHGAASKEQVAAMVASVLGCPPLEVPHDATDALALALTHVFRRSAAERSSGARQPAR